MGWVAIPFLLEGLGTERFGLLALAWAFLGAFHLLDLGLGRATTRFAAQALGEGRQERIPGFLSTAVVFQLLFGLLGFLALWGKGLAVAERILQVPSDLLAEARATFLLLGLCLPLAVISSSFRGALEAAQRFGWVNAVRAPLASSVFLLPSLGVALGWSLSDMAVALVIAHALALLALCALCLRRFPFLLCPIHLEDLASWRSLLGFGGWVSLSSLLAPVLLYTDRFAVGNLISLSAVSHYSVPFEVVIRLWMIPTSLTLVLFPAFSAMGRGDPEGLQRLYLRCLRGLLWVMGGVALLLALFGERLFRAWLGAEFAQASGLAFRILLVGAWLAAPAFASGCLLDGLGYPQVQVKLYLAYLIPNGILVAWLVHALGVPGAALSYALRAGVHSALLSAAAFRLLRQGPGGSVPGGGAPLQPRMIREFHRVAHRLKHRWLRCASRDNLLLAHGDGLPMYIYADTHETCSYFCGPFEPFTTELLKRAIRPGATFVDVGAQFGYFSLIAARGMGPRGRVYAFEAAPQNMALLERNIRHNGFSGVIHPIPKAVSDRCGRAELFLYEGSDSHGLHRHPQARVKRMICVERITLDEFLQDRPVDVIKLDIEGHEPYALRGMQRTLRSDRPLVVIAELAPAYLARAGAQPRQYLRQMEDLGFQIQLVDEQNRCLRPVPAAFLEKGDPGRYANLYCTRG